MEDVDEEALKKIERTTARKSFNVGLTISSLPSGPNGMFGLTLVLETTGDEPLTLAQRSRTF
jgi:hypothetical protein